MTADVSARIEEFRRTLDVESLRADLRAARGPLVEPAGEDVLVTFVWIGPQRQVSVRGAQLFADRNAMSHPMRQVEDTDVWCLSVVAPPGVTTVYQYLIDDPFLDADKTDLALLGRLVVESRERSYADPFNPNRLFPQAAKIAGVDEAPSDQWDSVLELPGLEATPWFDDEAPALTQHRLRSRVLGNERAISVYAPPGEVPRPLVILLDGESWLSVARLHVALGNLMTVGAIAPAVVAFVDNPPGAMTARMNEMACNPDLTRMLTDELLPLLRSHHDISDTVIVGGNSLGGLAASYAAYERPDVFGAVLSVSGSHWWGYRPGPGGWGKDGEPEWLTRQYAAAPRKPIRFWIDVGRLETGVSPLSPGVDQRAANRHLRTVLVAKGYDVTYHEAPGGHEFATFRRSVVKGLQALLPGEGGRVSGPHPRRP
jgi:enterochelin esterase family protein